MIEFFLPIIPPTKTYQQKQVHVVKGKPIFYEPQELKMIRNKFKEQLSKHVPKAPIDCAARLTVKWCFPISGNHFDGEYKYTKPDTDNLNKMLKDVMEDLKFFTNDSRVASEIIEKFWALQPGIYIKIEEL